MKGTKLAVLLVVAAFVVGVQNYVFFSKRGALPGPIVEDDSWEFEDEEAESPVAAGEIDAATLVAWLASQPSDRRSPFQTEAEALEAEDRGGQDPGELRASSEGPVLSGTLWSPTRRVAWIDGRAYSEGDWVGDSHVMEIDPSGVLLMRDGDPFQLHVQKISTSAAPKEQTDHVD